LRGIGPEHTAPYSAQNRGAGGGDGGPPSRLPQRSGGGGGGGGGGGVNATRNAFVSTSAEYYQASDSSGKLIQEVTGPSYEMSPLSPLHRALCEQPLGAVGSRGGSKREARSIRAKRDAERDACTATICIRDVILQSGAKIPFEGGHWWGSWLAVNSCKLPPCRMHAIYEQRI
jgi:hypothetical protein